MSARDADSAWKLSGFPTVQKQSDKWVVVRLCDVYVDAIVASSEAVRWH